MNWWLSTATRWVLSVALLYCVWRHAHWSSALCLTLVALRLEIVDLAAELR